MTTMETQAQLVNVELSAKIFPASKRDKAGEQELASSKQVDKDWYAVQRKRFPESVVTKVVERNPFSTMASSVGRLRNKYLYKLGFCLCKGQYIMKQEGWEIMEAARRSTDLDFESARAELSSYNYDGTLYSRMVREVELMAEEDFDSEDYPSLEKVLGDWCRYTMKATPFVGAEMLPEWITGPIREEMGRQHEDTFKRNSVELYREVILNMKKVADMWNDPDGRVVEATIDNLKRNLQFVEAKNIGGDEGVSALVAEAREAFDSVDAESLRGSLAFRQQVAANALSIAKKVKEDGKRRFA